MAKKRKLTAAERAERAAEDERIRANITRTRELAERGLERLIAEGRDASKALAAKALTVPDRGPERERFLAQVRANERRHRSG